jgi:hypothetical protein
VNYVNAELQITHFICGHDSIHIPNRVADTDADPFSLELGSDHTPDPDQCCGSGSFHHQAKILRKTLISIVLRLLSDILSLKNDVNVPSIRSRKI